MVLMQDEFDPEGYGGMAAMFFAGLILLIPHRIGMSRVNYVIKRYNLPISRAGLLLYKYHNNIELSLLCGTLPGNIIVWIIGFLDKNQLIIFNFLYHTTIDAPDGSKEKEQKNYLISIFMTIFLILMLISSIIMFIIYISGGDFGHLNAFYFSLIFLTLFDGFANAFAFAINGKYSSLLAAGIPFTGFLVPMLHNIYKFFSDLFHWDDFDYCVLRLQLFLNIFGILFAFLLWSVDQGIDIITVYFHTFNSTSLVTTGTYAEECSVNGGEDDTTEFIDDKLWRIGTSGNNGFKWPSGKCIHDIKAGKGVSDILELFNNNWPDFSPIFLLAISLGTVYAFYPSIAPYSIIDFQYASIIELWILVISAIPVIFAILDIKEVGNYGPSGKFGVDTRLYKTGDASKNVAYKDSNYYNSNDRYWNGGDKRDKIPKTVFGIKANWYQGVSYWTCVWFSAIPYILCIQIFMSMLHYPDCLLSCFFNNPLRIGFISVLFNFLRELMQACGFAGAGKQSSKLNEATTCTDLKDSAGAVTGANQAYVKNTTGSPFDASANAADSLKVPKPAQVNGTIAATNKLITLFVMMFCVFTGDGYLQHYRRCCRDCWPTTGYNKYQSFFYWLRFGFKGGIKSITSSFTDLYYHNLRPQFISYA